MTAPTIHATDTPRARRSDPLESHRAADRSQIKVIQTRLSVLSLVYFMGDLGGSEINDLYRARGLEPFVHFDSPRKRAGELAAEGLLNVVNPDAKRKTERIFTITEQGKRELGIA